MIGENNDTGGIDLSISTRDDNLLYGYLTVGLIDAKAYDPIAECNDLRLMAGPNTQLAINGCKDEACNISLIQQAIRSHKLTSQLSHDNP